MFGRYELIIADSNDHIIFQAYFQSINRLAKTLVCFDVNNLRLSVIDVVTDRRLSAYELRNVFMYENNIL